MENNYGHVVTTVVALLLSIIIGVMVYWSFVGGVTDMGDSITEHITSDSSGNSFSVYTNGSTTASNYTGERMTLSYPCYSVTNITCLYAGTTATLSWPVTKGTSAGNYYFDGKELVIIGDTTGTTVKNFTQVNVTYQSQTGHAVAGSGGVNDMSETVFALLPIIAIVVISAIILALLIGFGGSRKT